MGSRVDGSNSIPKTVLAQEGARQNVLNPKDPNPKDLNPKDLNPKDLNPKP